MKLFFKFLVVVLFSGTITSCHIGRFFYYNFADIKDHKKFPKQEIKRDTGLTYRHIPASKPADQQQLSRDLGLWDELSVDQYAARHKTVAFLILNGDSLIFEAYYNGYDSSAVIPVFSVAKSYISALVGIALEKGIFESPDDSITKYIPELRDKGLESITLRNLLEMRSGLDYQEKYNSPFADMAKYYYGRNLRRYITKLKLIQAPDTQYDYQSVNTLLLGMALENATGKNPAVLLEEWIWQPAGMQYDASWSFDSKKNKTIKAFCCINLRATDLARFGLLYKDKGKYRNQQIIPEQWIKNSLENTNDSRDSGGYPYAMHWRILPDGSFFAKGVLGQYLYVDPSRDIVIVRLGKSADKLDWIAFFREIVAKIQP